MLYFSPQNFSNLIGDFYSSDLLKSGEYFTYDLHDSIYTVTGSVMVMWQLLVPNKCPTKLKVYAS